jgi:transcriptional regulator with XRE-family HTH domain
VTTTSMDTRPRRAALGGFLKARRGRLSPADVGLPPGPRRRTPGLRREEVAELASMSANYVEQLEQGRGPQPSPPVLAALARALRFTAAERDHLYLLSGHIAPVDPRPAARVDAGLAAVVRSLGPATKAFVIDDLGRVLTANDASVAYFGRFHGRPAPADNMLWRWFTDPAWRASTAPSRLHDAKADAYVADLRGAVGRRGHDPASTRFVAALREAGGDFARRWDRHQVVPLPMGPAVLVGPDGADLAVDCATIPAERAGQRLFLFTPKTTP